MPESTQGQGPATDAANAPVIDPTENVKSVVEAEARRQDDLRDEQDKRIAEVAALRAQHAAEVLDLHSRLGNKEAECSKEMADLRERHAEQMRTKEAERINAIRQVDVEASQRDKEAAGVKADTLAKQVDDAAVVMRAQVADAATAAATSLQTALTPLQTAIEDLRRSQYQGQGEKTQVVERQAAGANIGLWVGLGVAIFFGFASLIAAIVVAVTV